MDGALIERARKGDADAFDLLARQRIDSVYRTALGILGNPADARDATQEALISAWKSFGSLRDAERFDAWLYRITLNAARMVARKRRGVRELRLTDDAEAANAGGGGAPARVVGMADFDRAFEKLTVDQRALLLDHHLDGLSIAQIAGRLGIAEGTVKSRLFAARQALDHALGEGER
jgi:RNA polymerase sigma-70 factor (ECF subfamily)